MRFISFVKVLARRLYQYCIRSWEGMYTFNIVKVLPISSTLTFMTNHDSKPQEFTSLIYLKPQPMAKFPECPFASKPMKFQPLNRFSRRGTTIFASKYPTERNPPAYGGKFSSKGLPHPCNWKRSISFCTPLRGWHCSKDPSEVHWRLDDISKEYLVWAFERKDFPPSP